MGSCLSSNSRSPPDDQNIVGPLGRSAGSAESPLAVPDPSDQPTSVRLPKKRDPPASPEQPSVGPAGATTQSSNNRSEEPTQEPAPPLGSTAQLTSEAPSTGNVEILSAANADRPKISFGPADSRMSVYTNIAEIEPVLGATLPPLPVCAEIPSASVTPAGNVLMHLNRAMILRNRMGPGAPLPSISGGKAPTLETYSGGPASSGAGVGSQPPSHPTFTTQSAGNVGDSFTASAFAGPVSSFGADGMGDSGIFEGPAGGTQSSIAAANALVNTASLPFGGPNVDSTGGYSLSGTSAALGGFPMSAFASGAGGAGPLHGLGVEATLSEMQQMALIGSGGGGCVYIGRWRGVTVAIKFIVSSNDDQLTRSQREALLSRLASHPHVVQTYATSVTQLTELMFKGKDGGLGDPQLGGLGAADPNISHDVLAGLTSGSWIRGELQMALHGGAAPPGAAPGYTAAPGAPLATILETTRSSAGSASAHTSSRAVIPEGLAPGSLAMGQAGTSESDGQHSSSSVTKPKGADAGGGAHIVAHPGPNDTSMCVTSSVVPSCHNSGPSSSIDVHNRLLQAAVNGTGPPGGSAPTSSENPALAEALAEGMQPPNSSGGGSSSRRNGGPGESRYAAGAAAAAAAQEQQDAVATAEADAAAEGAAARAAGTQPGGVADSFDASFVRDHLGRAKYSIHEVLRQLGAQGGQFLTMVVMEYCDGGSLLAALKEGPFHRDTTSWSPRMLLRSTVRTALEIAHGMQHLHLSGLLHGDLKPGNVLLKGSNQDKRKFVAKVSDLGMAHPVGSADEMSIDDGQIGSIAYMAPEVFRGRIMKASDVYSFGVVLWQLACGTGASPYEGAHPIAIALGVSEGKMTLRWPAGVFRPLQQLGELCIQIDPGARPSFKSVVGALEKLERHMQRLAAAATGPGTVSSVSPASSQVATGPLAAPVSGGLSVGSPSQTANLGPGR